MTVGSPRKPPQDKATKQLLKEGARSYHKAVTALIAFQQEVQKKCREVTESNLADYAAALKVRLSSSEIEGVAWPSFADWEGEGWGLGVEIVRTDIPNIHWWMMQCCLEHCPGEEGLYCWITEWLPARKVAHVFDRFHRLNRSVVRKGNYVWLEAPVKIEDVTLFEKSLERLFQQWITLWEKVGGIKAVFKG